MAGDHLLPPRLLAQRAGNGSCPRGGWQRCGAPGAFPAPPARRGGPDLPRLPRSNRDRHRVPQGQRPPLRPPRISYRSRPAAVASSTAPSGLGASPGHPQPLQLPGAAQAKALLEVTAGLPRCGHHLLQGTEVPSLGSSPADHQRDSTSSLILTSPGTDLPPFLVVNRGRGAPQAVRRPHVRLPAPLVPQPVPSLPSRRWHCDGDS